MGSKGDVAGQRRRWKERHPDLHKAHREAYYAKDPRRRVFGNLTERARKKELERGFTSYKELPECPRGCHWCGTILKRHTGDPGPRAISPTIDRVDNAQGYIPGNVVWSCHSCNVSKGNRPATEEWRQKRIINAY